MTEKKKPVEPAKAQAIFSKPNINPNLNSPLVQRARQTADSFRNFAMRLGVAAPGEGGGEQNVISDGTFKFNLITRNRILLDACYRGSWIVGRVVDCIAEDMTKAGVIMTTNEGADKLQDFKVQMSRLQIWQRIKDTTAWGRLYGGAIGVFQIDGQSLESPLDPETIEKGQFRGIAVYDRWQLNPVLSRIIEEGPEIGLPAYYDIVLGSNLNDPGQVPGQGSQTAQGAASVAPETGQTAGGPSASRVRVHHTRCFRMGGHKLPFFQAITEMMWDESVIERMWDRLIEFETATASAGGLIGRALLRTIKIKELREIIAVGGEAFDGLVASLETMRQFQTSEGLTILDFEDDFATTAYSFAGLSDILERFGEQLSGASETPLVRLFGQSPGGLNSNGEGDIRNYYDSINAKQESYLRNAVELTIKILWRSTFGDAAPKDLSFIFTPLWQMSAKDKADITAQNTSSIIMAHEHQLVDTPTAMKELKQASADTGVFTNITDDKIEEAELEPPPTPEMDPADPATEGGGTGDPGEGPTEPVKKAGADSMWKRLFGSKDERKAKKSEADKLREEADKADDKNKHHEAEGFREKARKLEKEIENDAKLKKPKLTADQEAIERWIKK